LFLPPYCVHGELLVPRLDCVGEGAGIGWAAVCVFPKHAEDLPAPSALVAVREVRVAEEQWRPVAAYEVRDRGRVRSIARTVQRGRFSHRVKERILAAATQRRTRLLQVALSCEGRQRRHYVQVLIREAFGDAAATPSPTSVFR